MSAPDSFFITTAIDYTNGAPHIGHAYEKVLADVIARYQRMAGRDVFFLTGVDQHGQKVQQSAEKQGVEPQEYVDTVTDKFRALWEKLDVQYDAWAATTEDLHKECVRANLQILWDDKASGTDRSRWIYKKTQNGFYSVRQEQFLTDKERGPDGEFGPEWQPVEEREEENFYFRLTAHPDLGFDPKQWLLDFIDRRTSDGNPFVIPDFRVVELRNAVEKLEGDLCISRPASRLKWGIPFPESFGAGFVTYVWFDALVNYISFVPGHDSNLVDSTKGQPTEFQRWWPALHVIGKDIMIPAHGVYWPIMLKALGFTDDEMPTLLVHGWWNIAGAKMSKSIGNIVDPDWLADKYGAEAVRYYLMSDIATGRDSDFSEERLIQRYNSDLANSLGNLLNRTLNMVGKYRDGEILNQPIQSGVSWDWIASLLKNLKDISLYSVNVYKLCYEDHLISSSLEKVSHISTQANKLVDDTKPWVLQKAGEDGATQLDAVLYHLAESLRIIAILISPVLPKAAAAIFSQLNWNGPMLLSEATWGKLPDGHILGTPSPIFPRIQVENKIE